MNSTIWKFAVVLIGLGAFVMNAIDAQARTPVTDEELKAGMEETEYIEEYVLEQMEERSDEFDEMDPFERTEEVQRLRTEAREAYRAENAEEGGADEAEEQAEGEEDSEAADGSEGESDAPTEEELETIFEDVDGEVAVYTKLHRKRGNNDGHMVLEEDDHVMEFCYADEGCEDRSEDSGGMHAGTDQMLVHQSDPDKEVVGLRLRMKVHPQSAASATALVVAGHSPDDIMTKFEIEEVLFETEAYEPGEELSYELGHTD